MYAQVENPKDNRINANSSTSKKSNVRQGFGFTNNQPECIAQRRLQTLMNTANYGRSLKAVIQLTSVLVIGKDDDGKLTADKKIRTKNQGDKWFRFPKDDNKIDSFSVNETQSSPKGTSPVDKDIEISNDASVNRYDIGTLSRATHFGAGDRLASIGKDYRKGKWTWHHKQNPYRMELVDMAVHKSFGHHGGFSKWQEGSDDDNDD